MSLLQAEMTRYYENMRPRFSNPTYASTNIGSSLGMGVPFSFRSSQVLEKSNEIPNSRMGRQSVMGVVRSNQQPNSPTQRQLSNNRKNSVSNLSNYGSNSLASLNRYISDKQVYEKQQKKYNIINVQPKQYEDTIKMYPKYRLENIDQNYYKKMRIEEDITARNSFRRERLNNPSDINNFSNPQKLPIREPIRGKYLTNLDEVRDVI